MLSCVGGVIGGIISKAEGTMQGATVSCCANYGNVSSDGCALGGVIGYSGQQTGNTISDVANYGFVESSNSKRIAGTIGNPMWNDKVHRIALPNCWVKGKKRHWAIVGCMQMACCRARI